MNPQPMAMTWDGEAMVPRSARAADERFVIGQVYMLEEHQERSEASHRHFFALVREAWLNLPDDLAIRFATPDQLRKDALIKAGFNDQLVVACANNIEAMKVAALAQRQDYAIVSVADNVVTIWTAKSQSMRAMGKAEFQASKDAVLEVLAEMIGVEPGALTAQAGRAA